MAEKEYADKNAILTAIPSKYADVVRSLPAENVREVILCRDCTYYANKLCCRWCDGTIMSAEDFCSRAVLKVKNDDRE